MWTFFKDVPEGPIKTKAILLAIDEIAIFSPNPEDNEKQKAAKKEIADRLSSIARIGQAAGIHMIITTQSPELVKTLAPNLMPNLDARIALGKIAEESSRKIIGKDDAAHVDAVRGRGILQVGKNFFEFQSYLLLEEDTPRVLEMAAALHTGDPDWLGNLTA